MNRMVDRLDRALYPEQSSNWDDCIFRDWVLSNLSPEAIILDIGAGAGIVQQMNFKGMVARVCGIDLDRRVECNPMLDEGYKENPFKAAERRYPVEMPYGFDETYILNMEIPEGYAVDELPKSTKVTFNEDEGFFEYLIAKDDNGIQFRFPPRYTERPTARFMTHMFNMRCQENSIEHRFTKIKHPWTNGQVERMNRTIKEATIQRYHYDRHEQLRQHLDDFISAYNFGRRLKTLKGLTPYEFICKCWTSQPERFTLNPLHQMPGLNT